MAVRGGKEEVKEQPRKDREGLEVMAGGEEEGMVEWSAMVGEEKRMTEMEGTEVKAAATADWVEMGVTEGGREEKGEWLAMVGEEKGMAEMEGTEVKAAAMVNWVEMGVTEGGG